MTNAFGVVALVALTPLIAIQIMGIVYKYKTDKPQKVAVPHVGLTDDSDDIIGLEEGMHSEAKGLVISLPVDEVMGI